MSMNACADRRHHSESVSAESSLDPWSVDIYGMFGSLGSRVEVYSDSLPSTSLVRLSVTVASFTCRVCEWRFLEGCQKYHPVWTPSSSLVPHMHSVYDRTTCHINCHWGFNRVLTSVIISALTVLFPTWIGRFIFEGQFLYSLQTIDLRPWRQYLFTLCVWILPLPFIK